MLKGQKDRPAKGLGKFLNLGLRKIPNLLKTKRKAKRLRGAPGLDPPVSGPTLVPMGGGGGSQTRVESTPNNFQKVRQETQTLMFKSKRTMRDTVIHSLTVNLYL